MIFLLEVGAIVLVVWGLTAWLRHRFPDRYGNGPLPAGMRAKWGATRAKGKWRYVLVNGVLLFGVTMCVTTIIADIIDNQPAFRFGPIHIVMWLSFGVVIGVSGWERHERRYALGDSARPGTNV